MRLEELFKVAIRLREGGVHEGEITPIDREKDADASARLLQRGVDYAYWMIGLIGFVVGVSSVMGITAGDGTRPINVLYIIAVTMVLPLLTLSSTVVLTLRAMRGKFAEGFMTDFAKATVRGGVWLASRALDTQDKATQLRIQAALGVVRGDYQLLEPVVPWLLRRLTQIFSLALSIGFVSALLIRQLGIDLTFGWQSTGDFLEKILPAITTFLSLPFGFLSADFVPSDELIHATRFSRFTGDYRGGPGSELLSWQWVPFLTAGAVFWGVLPRSLTLLWFSAKQSSETARVVASLKPIGALDAQLRGLSFAAPDPESQPLASDALRDASTANVRAGNVGTALRSGDRAKTQIPGALLLWQHDVPPPDDAVQKMSRALNCRFEITRSFGNRAADDRATRDELRAKKVQLVVLQVEPFTPPGAGFMRQIKELREDLGVYAPIIVEFAWYEHGVRQQATERQLEVWIQSLQKLGDRAIRWHRSEDASVPEATDNENAL